MACECELQNTLDVEVTQDALLDVEIGGSAGVLLQAKSVEVTANGTSVVAPDDGFDGLSGVEINTNVPKRFECGDAYFVPPASGATSIVVIKLLQKINVSCWDTSKVTSFKNMFQGFNSIRSLDANGWETSSVTDMSNMFSFDSKFMYLYAIGWNTSKVTNMYAMFHNCDLRELDTSGWNVSNVTNFDRFVYYNYNLHTLIGDKTLADVENGIVALRGTKVNISTTHCRILRFSSILALANGLADLTGQTAQTLTISTASYNNMYNDDDTIPTAEVIAERQARIAAICAAKNWNFAH